MQCTQCNAEWKASQSVTNCPFCHALLPVVKTYDTNSIEGKMITIVTQFSPEIYTKPDKFKALISDFLNGEDIAGLLKVIIEKNASVECYKLQGLSGNELTVNYNKTLDMVSSSSYIPKETISPALNLLCIGLGLDVPKPMVTQVQPSQPSQPSQPVQPVQPNQQVQPSQPPQQVQNHNFPGFVIIGNVLIEYKGAGGDVVIPDVVTAIGDRAFLGCKSLTSVNIPNSVTSIGIRAFFRCTSLKKINISDVVTSIGYMAFSGCAKFPLKTIDKINLINSTALTKPLF